jgi:hypothetical protein
MLSQPQLETERLFLRPLTFADASWIQKVASIHQIADTIISIPHPYPDGEAERYMSQQILEFEKARSVTFASEQKPEKLFSGIIER